MKNLTLQNFNYSVIDSAKGGYKEVLVTFKANGTAARKVCFIKEVKGKNNTYYLNEAKKQIESQIKNGTLAKNAAKQIKNVNSKGILKPVMITLSCVLGAGVIGTGSYFAYSYFTNPGVTPGPVTTGHTVVLRAGEGRFDGDKDFLIFNNVKEGTTLGDIEGYCLPTYKNYDFGKWEGPIIDAMYGASYKITEDIVLTATFYEGIKYLKSEAINSIKSELDYVVEQYALDDSIASELDKIYQATSKALDEIKETDDQAKILDARSLIKDLTECATDTLDAAGFVATYSPETVSEIETFYSKSIDELLIEENTVKRSAKAKLYNGYIKALPAKDTTIVESLYNVFDRQIKDLNNETQIRLLSHLAKGAIAGSGYYTDIKEAKMIQKTVGQTVTNILESELIKEDDTDTLDWVGDFYNKYFFVTAKYNSLDKIGYGTFITDTFSGFSSSLVSYLNTSSLKDLIYFNMGSSFYKALADAEIVTLDPRSLFYRPFPNFLTFNTTILQSTGTAKNEIDKLIDAADTALGREEKAFLESNASKAAKCVTNILEAFGIYQGEVKEDGSGNEFFDYEYLFFHDYEIENGKTVTTGVLAHLIEIINLDNIDTTYPLIDNYVTITEQATKVAKDNYLGSDKFDYEGICILSETMMYQTYAYMSVSKVSETFCEQLARLYNSIIPSCVDAGLFYESNVFTPIFDMYGGHITDDIANFLHEYISGAFICVNLIYKTCVDKPATLANSTVQAFITALKLQLSMLSSLSSITLNNFAELENYLFVNKTPELLDTIGEVSSKEKFPLIMEIIVGATTNVLETSSELKGSNLQFSALFDMVKGIFDVAPNLKASSIRDTIERISFAIGFVVDDIVTNYITVDYFAKMVKIKDAVNSNFTSKITLNITDDELNKLKTDTIKAIQEIIGGKL